MQAPERLVRAVQHYWDLMDRNKSEDELDSIVSAVVNIICLSVHVFT